MLSQISLYIKNPASPDKAPAEPAPEADDPGDVLEEESVHDLPYVGIPTINFSLGHPLLSQC